MNGQAKRISHIAQMATHDYNKICLTENDIPGAKLCYPDVCEHTVSQLN